MTIDRKSYPLIGGLLLLALAGAGLFGLTAARPAFAPGDARLEGPGNAEQGKIVFDAGDCASCHASPGQTDRHVLGGGLALRAPGGTFRVPNISSDPQDGIGRWSSAGSADVDWLELYLRLWNLGNASDNGELSTLFRAAYLMVHALVCPRNMWRYDLAVQVRWHWPLRLRASATRREFYYPSSSRPVGAVKTS